MIGFPLGFGNGILIWLITQIFFSPLKNAYLYRRAIGITSTVLGIAVSFIYFKSFFPGSYSLRNIKFKDMIIWIVPLSIMIGLTMGIASQTIAKWYERESRKKLKAVGCVSDSVTHRNSL